MVTKILITLLVIAGCYLYLKRRDSNASQQRQPAREPIAESQPVKMIAVLLLALSVLATLSYVGYRWYDSHTLLDVRIINPENDNEVVYQVYKGDLDDRSFTTVQGQTVRISNSERLEIRPAAQ
ncbi:MAG: hypothetical protein V7731_08355 [Amphritea sp.]